MTQVTLKGKPVTLMGKLPPLQSKIPNFVLVDTDLSDRSLKDFSGKKKLLLIVPSLDTSTCSTMTKKFNDTVNEMENIYVLVISADLPFAQKRFCATEGIKNVKTLSMMRSKDFAKDYGVLIQDGPLAGICARAIILVSAEDTVDYVQLVPEITSEPDYQKVIEALLAS